MADFLSNEKNERYQRQMILPGFGNDQQKKLADAKVLVVGAGGLGCPALMYLAAAGVGTLGIVDHDQVGLSNLHRQLCYKEEDVGKQKTEACKEFLLKMNSKAKVNTHTHKLLNTNALEKIGAYDLIIDATDNFPSRYLINDACVLTGKVLVYGSVHQFDGQVAVFNFHENDGSRSANYRDLYPKPPKSGSVPDCAEGGVLGVLPGVIGTMQATEAIKIITGVGNPLKNKLLMYDGLNATVRTINYKNTNSHLSITQLIDYEYFCNVGSQTDFSKELSFADFLKIKSDVPTANIIDVREEFEHVVKNLGGRNIPLSEIEANGIGDDESEIVVVYCATGKRGRKAVDLLTNKWGHKSVFNLSGGIEATNT